MNAKAAITFILGLVFQFVQVLPAAVLQSPCQPQIQSCACCAAKQTCQCAKNSKSDGKQAPAPLQSENVLKIPAAKLSGTHVAVPSDDNADSPVVTSSLPNNTAVIGFTGVRLSVAFCSFVI